MQRLIHLELFLMIAHIVQGLDQGIAGRQIKTLGLFMTPAEEALHNGQAFFRAQLENLLWGGFRLPQRLFYPVQFSDKV